MSKTGTFICAYICNINRICMSKFHNVSPLSNGNINFLAFHQLWHSTRVNIRLFATSVSLYSSQTFTKIDSNFHIYFCTCEFVANLLIFCVFFFFLSMYSQFALSFPRIDCIKKRLSTNKDYDKPIYIKILFDSISFLY